jgi:hypothetical protein
MLVLVILPELYYTIFTCELEVLRKGLCVSGVVTMWDPARDRFERGALQEQDVTIEILGRLEGGHCERCWRVWPWESYGHWPEHPTLCDRCGEVVTKMLEEDPELRKRVFEEV